MELDMSDSSFSAPHFPNEEAAHTYVEARIWPRGPICPHCGGVEKNRKMQGKSTRIGVYKCYDCRNPFTVKLGTIFEDSHIRMNVWLQAIFLVASSKKGVSSNQLPSHVRDQPEVRMVHEPQNPRSDERKGLGKLRC